MLARVLLASALLIAAGPARAQPPEASPAQLRTEARAALAQGRIEDAFPLMRRAAEGSQTPTDWRELAEIADRLRLDDAALAAYATYLERAPQADDRAAIEGRIRVLRLLAEGARFAVAGGVPELLAWNGEPVAREPGQNVLVDWHGRPQGRRTELLTMAEWEGDVRPPEPPIGAALAPRGGGGLGRALAAP